MAEVGEEVVRTFVRGFSRSVILWLINQQPLSGYKIVKEMNRLTGQRFHPGKVYPLLYELERDGYIVGDIVQRGRQRIKYYATTERGIALLDRIRSVFESPMKEVLTELLEEADKPL